MEFPPCAQGNREGGKNSYTFYYIYKIKFFAKFGHCLNSSVSRAIVHGMKGTRFESWPQTNFFFIIFIIPYYKMLLLYVKTDILYGNVMDLIIHALKVLISNILLIFFSTMRSGLDKKEN